MFAVNIDISDVINELKLNPDEINSLGRALIDRVADMYWNNWNKMVNENLHGTRGAYQSGMDIIQSDSELAVTFVLTGKGQSRLGMMIEEGASAFDIKTGMENSPKAHHKADGGWYITIPFRHATPEAIGESSIFSNKMPKEIHFISKQNDGAPIKFEQLPAEHQELEVRPNIESGTGTIIEYEHRSPIYEGLQQTGKPGHEQYHTFRRISNNSDPDSWIHKGFTPHKFMEKTMEELESSGELEAALSLIKEEFLQAKFENK